MSKIKTIEFGQTANNSAKMRIVPTSTIVPYGLTRNIIVLTNLDVIETRTVFGLCLGGVYVTEFNEGGRR